MAGKASPQNNVKGILAFGLGIMSGIIGIMNIIIFIQPLIGIALGVAGVIIAKKQLKIQHNDWAKAGFIISIIGIILSLIAITLTIILATIIVTNPEIAAMIFGGA